MCGSLTSAFQKENVQFRLSPHNLHHQNEKQQAKVVYVNQKGFIVAFSKSTVIQPIWSGSICKLISVFNFKYVFLKYKYRW